MMEACHPRCSRLSRPGNVCTPQQPNYPAICPPPKRNTAILMHVPCSLPRCAQCVPLDDICTGHLGAGTRAKCLLPRFLCFPDADHRMVEINPPLVSQAPSAASACLACTLRSYHTESPTIHSDSPLVGSSRWANFPLAAVVMSSANYGLSNISEKERDTVMPLTSWTENSRWGSGQVHACFSPSGVRPNYWRS
ncbi:hypothetical protein BO78DRAFT_399864 [Aspergillus sclerotiicarbonarius CBS 121057]|uniref:Uncharacterized protein n=1 Tax=Aspergillus sclerotiicarbonarius (strain CBS 121057 / IBT 28362) TaxID=1448318 RepID=A0A319E019_ASPSB|nr:hypothetical protein BO78DRAFT_399864 [Aspergillus sclerotiicarbonarius CBS 121057]